MRRIIEAPEATNDRDAIWLDGLERFGPEQADRLQIQIDQTLEHLAVFPETGVPSSRNHPQALGFSRPYPCKIIYRYDADTLTVLRVYHGKQQKD